MGCASSDIMRRDLCSELEASQASRVPKAPTEAPPKKARLEVELDEFEQVTFASGRVMQCLECVQNYT